MTPIHGDPFGGPVWHRLHHDLLYHIFTINGDMFSDKTALDTTRRTSQVCRAWRELMLEMPSLWGRLVDLDTLSTAALPWSHELLQRSGNAPLWIMSVYLRGHRLPYFIQFFFDVLDKQWHRIQRLVIDSGPTSGSSFMYWAPLYRPTPCLQICEVNLGLKPDVMKFERDAPGPLFANRAPMLRELNIWAYSSDLRAPWFCRLRSINIYGTNHTISELVTALHTARNLEILTINMPEAQAPTSLPPLYLPNLRKLDLFVNVNTCIALLDCFEVPCGYSLCYRSSESSTMESAEDNLQALVNRLPKFARFHFQAHKPTKISLTYYDKGFRIEDTSSAGAVLFSVVIKGFQYPKDIVDALFNVFALPELSSTTEVRLHLISRPPPGLFVSFLTCLPFLEVINIDEYSILHLLHVPGFAAAPPGVPGMIFPALRVLKVSMCLSVNSKVTVSLVIALRAAGYPLAVLDLTQNHLDMHEMLDALEEFHGLVVRWRMDGQVLEYVCGSADEERAGRNNALNL